MCLFESSFTLGPHKHNVKQNEDRGETVRQRQIVSDLIVCVRGRATVYESSQSLRFQMGLLKDAFPDHMQDGPLSVRHGMLPTLTVGQLHQTAHRRIAQ